MLTWNTLAFIKIGYKLQQLCFTLPLMNFLFRNSVITSTAISFLSRETNIFSRKQLESVSSVTCNSNLDVCNCFHEANRRRNLTGEVNTTNTCITVSMSHRYLLLQLPSDLQSGCTWDCCLQEGKRWLLLLWRWSCCFPVLGQICFLIRQ